MKFFNIFSRKQSNDLEFLKKSLPKCKVERLFGNEYVITFPKSDLSATVPLVNEICQNFQYKILEENESDSEIILYLEKEGL